MADGTKIEWTDATWNPVTGCSVVSPGCTNCYAMKLAGTRMRHHHSRQGLTIDTKAGPVWNGQVRLNEAWLDQPVQWRKPRRIFVCAHGDLFHESVPLDWIDKVYAVMAEAPQHQFQVLTKRASLMQDYISDAAAAFGRALPNVWLGVSVEDQARADERIPHLLATPAAVRFLSYEPALGPIDLSRWIGETDAIPYNYGLSWIIAGGESGPNARPPHPQWFRDVRDACQAAAVPFFFKQWGEWAPTHQDWPKCESYAVANDGTVYRSSDLAYPDGARRGEAIRADHDKAALAAMYRIGKKAAGATLDGREHREFPT